VARLWLTTCRVRSTLADVMILLVVGVGVVVLGALVLLLFPNRPGGKIAWQGVEVSSIGVGLPLIVVGLAAIAISSGGVIGGDGGGGASEDQTIATLKCPDDLTKSLPPQRVATVESGANAQIIAGPTMSKTEPFGLRLTDGGRTVGAMTARFVPASGVFKVQSFVDVNCNVGQVQNLAQPGQGPLSAIPTWSDVRIDLLGRLYRFNLGSGDDIRVNFSPFVP
jgi:hypothetical protein